MSKILILAAALSIGVFCIWLYRKKYCSNNQCESEHYEPQNMGSRKYWGWGRDYGYAQWDTHEDRYFCYPASLREFWQCLPGYRLRKDAVTGIYQCCVNEFNY